ncbi:two-component sensor histidine kinase [Cystobacter fuscus]|uniref:histidine kinase n=1 Tax=Cystobacter fuscus TaxID=43 RepID=A0A250JBL3_9BACT|nr:ATP-binding protein [Cystobacter fuscus]ATB40862.1 two-component sensor histidine kinase [Cystobacter fuscus]
MTADSSGLKALLRMQRRNYFIGAGCLTLGLVLHCVVMQSFPRLLVGLQAAWTMLFALMGVCVGAGWLPMKWAGVIASVVGFVALTSFILLSGGPESPYFCMYAALPFILAVFTPGSRMPTLLSGGVSLVAIVIVNAMADVPLSRVILQLTSYTTFLGLALVGTRMYRHMLDAQLAAHQERLQALEQLAESERLRARAALERAEVERLVLVGQLAAGVAHEVNNPLAFVKANLSYLQRETADEAWTIEREEFRDVLDETKQGVMRIQQIVTDLRGFSRADPLGEQEPGVLEEALKEAKRLASVRLREGGEVSLALAPELPAVRLGQRHMVQVLVNLLINAADAAQSARPPRRPHIKVSAHQEAGAVCLRVEDNGPGIPPDVLPRLFEPFFTTKPPGQGTGLGLALCRDYVARVGGTLHAENHSGGARFVLMLPAASDTPAAFEFPKTRAPGSMEPGALG